MKPYISVITLAANNLEQSLKFYCEGLGLHSEGILVKNMNMVRLLLLNSSRI